MRRPAFIRLLSLLVLLVVTACGTTPGGGEPTPTGPVAAKLVPEGTTVEIVTDDLMEVSVEFPAGAVLAPIDLTFTPLPRGQGEMLRLRVEPAGTQLLEPAIITLSVPAGSVVPVGSTFAFFDGTTTTPLPTAAAPNRLTHETMLLGYAAVTTSDLGAQQGGNGWFSMAQLECQIALDSIMIRLEYVRNFPFSSSQSAYQLIQSYEATETLCDPSQDHEEALEGMRELAKQVACDGYVDATADAAVILSESIESVIDISSNMLNWGGFKAAAGADCGGLGGELQDVLEQEFDEFVGSYESRMTSGDFPSSYAALWAELRSLTKLFENAAMLGLPEAQESVSDRLLARVLTALREEAYASCKQDLAQIYLADILTSGNVLGNPLYPGFVSAPPWATFERADLLADIQYCASALTIDVQTSQQRVITDSSRTLLGGEVPEGHVTSASTESGVLGTLDLSGELWAFNCARGDQAPQFAPDTMVVKLAGVEVARLQPTAGRFFSAPEQIDIADALQEAAKDPTLLNTYPLEIWRESAACNGNYGSSEAKLFSVDIEFDPVPVLATATSNPSSVPATITTAVIYTLDYEDQGENLTRLTGTYALGATGGELDIDVFDADLATGFDKKTGDGQYNIELTVHCSEAGINPFRMNFQLVDSFDQKSDPRSADVNIDYSECGA